MTSIQSSLFILLAIFSLHSNVMAKGGSSGTKGGGSIYATDIKDRGRRIFDALLKAGIQEVAGHKISELKSKLDNCLIDDTEETLYIEEVVDGKTVKRRVTAINDHVEQTIIVNVNEYGQAKTLLKDQISVHETLGLNKDLDRDYKNSYEILSLAQNNGKKATEGRALPADAGLWIVQHTQDPTFASEYSAVESCMEIAKPFTRQYKNVICEPTVKYEKGTFRWSEIVRDSRFAGIVVNENSSSHSSSWNNFFYNIFTIGDLASESFSREMGSSSSSHHSRDESPVMESVSVKHDMYRDYEKAFFGYRILVNEALIANTDVEEEIYDSLSQQMVWPVGADPIKGIAQANQATLEFCSTHITNLWRADYEAKCQIYRNDKGDFAYRIIGKKKYRN